MKKCLKLAEPATLQTYRQAKPQAMWEEMQNDPFHSGQQAYRDAKNVLIKGQRCLCVYCETRIADGTENEVIEAKKHKQRVEHFHPKSDRNGPVNWHLHWPNLWAVCQGGSQSPGKQVPFDPKQYLPPLRENLSCDAFKDRQIETGQLPKDPEGWILAPDEIPAFPLLFQFAPDGTPEPHAQNCANLTLPNNHHPDAATLVAETIKHLNLGCVRLNRNRCIAKAQLEKQIAKARQTTRNQMPSSVLQRLAQQLLQSQPHSAWPEFFSLVRWRLGEVAEEHLEAISYQG